MFKMGERVNFEWVKRIGPVITINIFNRNMGLCFCHRKEERCFKIHNNTFPICSRCCGLYAGAMLSMILLWFFPIYFPLFCILLLFPLIIDGGAQYLFDRESNNMLRFSTGLLFSFGMVNLLGVII